MGAVLIFSNLCMFTHYLFYKSFFTVQKLLTNIQSDTFNLFLIANYVKKKFNFILLSLGFCDRECESESKERERKKEKAKLDIFS